MGVYESIQRSQGSIDKITSSLGAYLKHKADEEKRKKLSSLMYEDKQVIKPDVLASLGMNQQEIPLDQAERSREAASAAAGGMNRPGEFTPEPSQTETQKQFMGVNAKNAPAIAEIMRMPPEDMVNFLSGVQGREESRKRANILNVSEGTDVIDLSTGETKYRNPRDFSPGKETFQTDKKINSYTREDGKLVNIFQKPDGSTYEQESEGNVRQAGGAMTEYQRRSLGLREDEAARTRANEGKISRTVTYVKPDGRQGIKTYSGNPEEVITQIQSRLNSIDAVVKRTKMASGETAWYEGDNASWDAFVQGKAKIDDLPSELQGYASEYEELQSQSDDLQSMIQTDGGGMPAEPDTSTGMGDDELDAIIKKLTNELNK